MQSVNFEEVVERIVAKDPRYHRDAYFFLREALTYTQKAFGKSHKTEVRHVSGRELLTGIREYATTQFGPMTLTVLDEWGIHATDDFGEMVFNMIEHSLLAKTDTDSRDDFFSTGRPASVSLGASTHERGQNSCRSAVWQQ